MTDVFDYLDFRQYLRDYYAARKAGNPSFSYENFARKAGLKSKGMLHDIMGGKRNLTRDSLYKVAEACGLAGEALVYFENLVAYGQSKSLKERNFFLARLRLRSPGFPDSGIRALTVPLGPRAESLQA